MKRKDFLRGLGLAGAASVIPSSVMINKLKADNEPPNSCTLIPTETAGPFPLDLSANNFYFRQDVRETKTGVQLNVKLKIIGLDNCNSMPNLRVNIWHCDKDGLYSGYSQQNNQGQAGLTYLRGYQMTDANGEVEFITILPGWYQGRVCHIHFQVYVSSSYAAISQLTFDPTTKNVIYAEHSDLYNKGADPLTIQQDNIFSDGYVYQLATLTPNPNTGGYDSFLEVTVKGSGTLSSGYIEKLNEQYFSLGQNYPNPYESHTNLPLTIRKTANVTIDFYDLSGKKVATIEKSSLLPGDHVIPFNLSSLNLPAGNYVYQVNVQNVDGVFTAHKMMTSVK